MDEKVTKALQTVSENLVGKYTEVISPPFDMLSWNVVSMLVPYYKNNANSNSLLLKVKAELEPLAQAGAQSDAAQVINFVMSSL